MEPIRTNLTPTWSNLGPIWLKRRQLGATWDQLESTWDQLRPTWGQFQPPWSNFWPPDRAFRPRKCAVLKDVREASAFAPHLPQVCPVDKACTSMRPAPLHVRVNFYMWISTATDSRSRSTYPMYYSIDGFSTCRDLIP